MTSNRRAVYGLAALLVTFGVVLLLGGTVGHSLLGALTDPTATPEPIIPTVTPSAATGGQSAPLAVLSPTPALTALALQPTTAGERTPIADYERFGVSGRAHHVAGARDAGLPFRHFLDWTFRNASASHLPQEVQYWHTLSVGPNGLRTPGNEIERAAAQRPGAIWIVGNEPDVRWQEDLTPELYAVGYHEAYTLLKSLDPTAQIAVGAVAQGTPLRLAYLDRVLQAYQEQTGNALPADWWTVHAYVLREERDSWGVDIPAGFDDVDQGELYEIADHGRIDLFEENLVRFRRWMATNGYQALPLAVTEFGILLPTDYGFAPDMVADYMHASFDVMGSLRDEAIGMPDDDYHLVQTWFWYMLEDTADRYPTGNLYDSKREALTPLGQAYRAYVLETSDR